MIEKNINKSGIVKGTFSYLVGQAGFDQGAADLNTGTNNLRLGAQALVPGVPSNKDLGVVLSTLPSPHLATPVNESRLKFSKEIMGDLVEATISVYKGQGFFIPQHYKNLAKKYDRNIDKIQPWDQQSPVGDKIADKAEAFLAKEKGSPHENWVARAMQANRGLSREQIIQRGIGLGKLPKGFK